MENKPVILTRDPLEGFPDFPVPGGFTLRCYAPGDETAWRQIHLAADRYNVITPELYTRQFGSDARLLAERQFFLCDPDGHAVQLVEHEGEVHAQQ